MDSIKIRSHTPIQIDDAENYFSRKLFEDIFHEGKGVNPDHSLSNYTVFSGSQSKYHDNLIKSFPKKKSKPVKKKVVPKKLRPYQSQKWQEFFDELAHFKRKNGNCLVPHDFPANPPLARWVKRQRYQYNQLQQGKKASITKERIQMLNDIGFVWDSHEASWEERVKELQAYKAIHGTCSVPTTYKENPRLATWVKCQRRQYKLFREGKPANISAERIDDLEKLGFEWDSKSASKNVVIVWETGTKMLNSVPSDYELMLDVLSLLSDESTDGNRAETGMEMLSGNENASYIWENASIGSAFWR